MAEIDSTAQVTGTATSAVLPRRQQQRRTRAQSRVLGSQKRRLAPSQPPGQQSCTRCTSKCARLCYKS